MERDEYTCQHCKVTKTQLHVHHIIYRSKGGSNDETNLITLCKTCHEAVHKKEIHLNLKGKKKNISNT